jgi:ATP-dependent DNA ligase
MNVHYEYGETMINQIFEQLAATSSRNAKISILTQNKDDDLLEQVIFLALDPFTQFYIRKIPAYAPRLDGGTRDLTWALTELTKLSRRQVTGNAAIEHLSTILEQVSIENAKVIERIIQKDLKCGVSEGIVNAVWKNFIHEYPCMLASAYDQKLVDAIVFPAYAQLKCDGARFNAIVRDGAVEFRSRNGKEIQIADPVFGLPFIHMAATLGIDCVFDGELLAAGPDGQYMDRKTGNGIVNKAVKGTQSVEEGRMMRAILWDVIPLDKFETGIDREHYQTRMRKLEHAINTFKNGSAPLADLVNLVPSVEVANIDKARELFEQYLANGQEGIILKAKNMIWENKRSKHQIKFKGELECDLKVVEWIEGTGKHANRMGALVLESCCGGVRVNVGTGFSDADRMAITPGDVGRIVAIKYNARITDKRSDIDSLFLPVFIEFRDDKNVADSSRDIK